MDPSHTSPRATIRHVARVGPGRADIQDRLLFGAVSTASPVAAVVRRLTAAVALGFLADGDRLPREADLARQMGVTGFAMREALGIMREEGLITTRPGNRGGSFIRPGTDRTQLTSGELRRISASELRDLGDWRQMLATESASLAAQRRSDSNLRGLHDNAAALVAATTEFEARRAHGRFHLELAAAAQSWRITEAQIAMYEQFDWLLGLALADPGWRAQAGEELRAIADAVAQRRPEAAKSAAAAHSVSTVVTLNEHRLAAIASNHSGSFSDLDRSADGLAREVQRVLAAVLEPLVELAARTQSIVSEPFDERDLHSGLGKIAVPTLVSTDLALGGMGFNAEQGLVPGRDYWIAWWQETENGVQASHPHVLEPSRDDFYDYTAMDCFVVPRRTGHPYIQGPYVDYGGANDYIVTVAVPASVDGRFVGVAAADLPVTALEHKLAPWLAAGEPFAVLAADHRVVVANTIDQTVGDLVHPTAGSRSLEVPGTGWSVRTSPNR